VTKPLPARDVEARIARSGKARLSAVDNKVLAQVEDENLKKAIGELLLSTHDTQENFAQIEQWFPIQPADVASALRNEAEGLENTTEGDQAHFWVRWRSKTNRLIQSIRGYFGGGEKGEHVLRLEVQGEPQDANHRASLYLYAYDEKEDSGLIAVVKGGSTAYILKSNGGKLESDFLFKNMLLAKGNLISAKGAAEPVVLAVGEDGKILVADSTATSGLKWKTAKEAAAEGPEGRSAGLKYTYSTNTESSDPGAGKFKLDKATLSEATIFRISETDGDANALAAYLATIDDSTSTVKGTIVIRKVGAPTVFAILQTSGILNDNGTWDSFTIAHVASNGLANNDVCTLEFIRTGDLGATGAKGEKGEKGEAGTAGAAGRAAALHYKWLTNTEATDPTAGKLKTTVGKTLVRISETDLDGNGIAALIATWDDSTTTKRGYLTVRQVSNPKKFIVFAISGVNVDEGTFDKLTTEPISEGEAIDNEAEVMVEFSRTGDKGEQGEKGATGEKGEKGEKGAEGAKGEVGGALMYTGSATHASLGVTPLRELRTNKAKWSEVTEVGFSLESINWPSAFTLLNGPLSIGSLVMIRDTATNQNRAIYKVTSVKEETANAVILNVVFVASTGGAEWELGTKTLEVDFYAPRDWGLVSALPGTPKLLDTCSLYADKTNGVVWKLLYDGEGEFPWKKIGGPPLEAQSNELRELTNKTAYESLPTDPLKVKVPVKGDYDISIEAAMVLPATVNSQGLISYAIGATAANDNWSGTATNGVAVAVGFDIEKKTRQLGVAASAEIIEKARTIGNYTVKWARRRLYVDPIRVG
jgi:hypothetical protein